LEKYQKADGSKLIFDVKRLEEKIIIDASIENIDKEIQDIQADEQDKIKISDEDIERKFISFLKRNCGTFQQARSFDKIRVSVYQIFDKYLNISGIDRLYIQKFVLANEGFFQNIIQNSIKEYAKDRNKNKKQYKENNN
jgi:hypothetical protein